MFFDKSHNFPIFTTFQYISTNIQQLLKHSLFFFAFVLSLALLSSCNPARQLEKGKLRKKSAPFLLKKMSQNQVDADWFSGKAKVAFAGDGQRLKASANILMRKDSVVWLNVKKLNIEVARVQITPDSIYLLNRLTREYAVYDLSYLQKQFNLPLGFADLQELLLGNSVMIEPDGLSAAVVNLKHQLSGQQAGVETTYALNGLSYLLEQTMVSDANKTWEVQIDQGEHRKAGKAANFPYFRNFAVSSEATGPLSLEIKFLKIELNVPKTIKFEIPSRYTEMR